MHQLAVCSATHLRSAGGNPNDPDACQRALEQLSTSLSCAWGLGSSSLMLYTATRLLLTVLGATHIFITQQHLSQLSRTHLEINGFDDQGRG
jgi:hypothetical protein